MVTVYGSKQLHKGGKIKMKKKLSSIIMLMVVLVISIVGINTQSVTLKQEKIEPVAATGISSEIKLKNLPCTYTVQKFYFASDKDLYITFKPCTGTTSLLCHLNIEDDTATCDSCILVNNSGHGMILTGEKVNGKTYLYVGYEAKKIKVAINKKGDKPIEAHGIARIDYDSVDKFIFKNNKWVYYKNGTATNMSYTSKNFYTSKNVANLAKKEAVYMPKVDGGDNTRILSFQELLGTDANKFVKFDFVIAANGANMVYIKYRKNNTDYIKTMKLQNRVFNVMENNTDNTNDIKAKTIGLEGSVINNSLSSMTKNTKCWQSTAAWTRYDMFITTQDKTLLGKDVKWANGKNIKWTDKIKKGSVGIYAVRSSNQKLNGHQYIEFKVPEDMVTSCKKIADNAKSYINKKNKNYKKYLEGYLIEVEGTQFIQDNTKKGTLYVLVRGAKDLEKGTSDQRILSKVITK